MVEKCEGKIVGDIKEISDGRSEGNGVGIADDLFDGMILGIFDEYWLVFELVKCEEIIVVGMEGMIEGVDEEYG